MSAEKYATVAMSKFALLKLPVFVEKAAIAVTPMSVKAMLSVFVEIVASAATAKPVIIRLPVSVERAANAVLATTAKGN